MNYQIIIDGDICRWGYSKQYLKEQLRNFKGKHVDMRISSLGGDLDHALDMRQQLIDHADVTVFLSGFVASAATVIAMGAQRVCMSKYAMFLVHKCSNFVDAWGYYNADEIQDLIADLETNKRENDKIDVVLASMYAERCGKKISEILDVLKRGEWLTAQEALDYGFIDEIIEDSADNKVNFSPDLRCKFNAYNLPMPVSENRLNEAQSSLISQIVKAIKAAFSPNSVAVVEKSNEIVEPQMKVTTDYKSVNNALGVDSLSQDDNGTIAMTAGQMQALEDCISKLNGEVESLNAKVEAFKNMPADSTTEVKDDEPTYMSTEEVYNFIKNL